MNDFEVCQIGTNAEILLSRALAVEIDQTINQYGDLLPYNIVSAFKKLKDHYELQLQLEIT